MAQIQLAPGRSLRPGRGFATELGGVNGTFRGRSMGPVEGLEREQGMTLAASAVLHDIPIDRALASAGSFWCARRVENGRLLINLQRLESANHRLDPMEPAFDALMAIRRRISVVPCARGHVRSMVAGIVRRGIEEQVLGLRTEGLARHPEDPLREVVDHRLATSIDAIARDEAVDDSIVIESHWGPTRGSGGSRPTNWRRRLVAASIGGGVAALIGGWLLKSEYVAAFGLAISAAMPLVGRRSITRSGLRSGHQSTGDNPGPDPHGSEAIRVGRGWIETGSGRRRHRDAVVTTVLRERDDSDRIEVRIIGADRIVRLRFESVNDQDFRSFWARWAA